MSLSIQRKRPSHHPLRILLALVLLVTTHFGTVVPAVSASMQSTATLELTLRGCPEGVIPQNVNPAGSCTVPLDAPGSASALWSGGGVSVPQANRDWDGTYRISVPANIPISLANFEPEVRDDFYAVGTDGVDYNGDPVLTLAPGTSRHVGIYYYYFAGSPSQATGTLSLTLRGCPEGIIPQNVNPAASCTVPLDAPDPAGVWYGSGSVSMLQANRDWSGTYHVSVPANVQVTLADFEPAVRDDFYAVGVDGIGPYGDPVVTVAPGETRNIGIYYYYYAGGSSSAGNSQGTNSSVIPADTASSGESSVAIITSIVGWPYTSACYELVDYSAPVCSVMIRDMHYAAVFPDVPPGTYTVRQTSEIESGYVPDFTIEVTGGEQEFFADVVMDWGSPSRLGAAYNDPGVEGGFDVIPIEYDTSAPDFWTKQANNVSFVFVDTVTHEKVISEGCVQVVGISEVTCDTGRGQIDILDVPVGDHEVVVTTVPEGYQLAPGMEELRLQPIGRNPHAPVNLVYFIDVSPTEVSDAGASPVTDAPDAAVEVDPQLLTICASNRHGVDYPALIFNLSPDVAVQAGFMVEDGQGNLVPEWQGVRPGECTYSSGFHIYENVASETSLVTYCVNDETLEGPANEIGADFIDPARTGQALHPGAIFINWRTAPDGFVPGPCSDPMGMNGEKLYVEIIGSWEAGNRSAVFLDDGTGTIQYTESNGVDVVELDVEVDTSEFPVVATVVAVSTGGNPDLSRYPAVGDTVSLMIVPANVLEVELTPGWSVAMCAPGAEPFTFNLQCFE